MLWLCNRKVSCRRKIRKFGLSGRIKPTLIVVLIVFTLVLTGCDAAVSFATPGIDEVKQSTDRLTGWLKEKVTHAGHAEGEFLSVMNNLYDWPEIGLIRHEGRGFDNYLTLTEQYVSEAWQNPDGLRKATDLERLTLAISAAGGDARDVGGHDLISALCNHSRFDDQGVNSPIFALLALDCKGYEIPEGAKWNREKIVQRILKFKNEDGSFGLNIGEQGSPDITAMVIQALWGYTDNPDVKTTVKDAVTWLAEAQQEDGGYMYWDVPTSEAASQVVIALFCLGIDVTEDSRFNKGGNNPLTFLLSFQKEDGGFCHIIGKKSNKIASEQAMLALTAWLRMKDEKPALYDYVNY